MANAADLAKELDEKLDKYIDALPKTTYKEGFSEDNWEEEFEKIPFFMTKEPTEADIAASPELSAIQALKYDNDDDTPEEKAKSYKDDGNAHFQRKHYKTAVGAYTEGLKQKCDNVDLNTVLYTNRAAANFHLGNHRTSLNDAVEAVKLKPSHVKALLRAAQCCLKLKEYTECIQWCDKGLQIDSNDKKFLDVRVLAVKEKKTIEKDRRKKKTSEKKELAKMEKILMAIKKRNIKFAALPTEDEEEKEEGSSEDKLQEARIMAALATSHISGAKVELDEEGALNWPVRLLYPEYSQTDFIEAFNENSRFVDHFEVMFNMDEVIPWDEDKVYTPDNLEIYFEDITKRQLVKVNPNDTVKDVLQNESYQVVGNTPTFLILSKVSPFRDDYLKKYSR